MIPEHVRLTALTEARSYLSLKIHEEPLGSNRGLWVQIFQETAGLNDGDAWCMAYVVHCFERARKIQRHRKRFLKRTGWCKGQWLYALKSNNRLEVLTAADILLGNAIIPPGSVWIRYNELGAGHTGIVEFHDIEAGEIVSNEGNASDGVKLRSYKLETLENFKGVIF